MKVTTCLFACGLCLAVSAVAIGDESSKPNEALLYKFKPHYSYRYDFEVRSGEDNDGFLQLDGSVNYGLVPAIGQPSLIDEAFQGDDPENSKGKSLEIRYNGIVNGKQAQSRFIDGTIRVAPRGDAYKLQGDGDFSLVSSTVGSLAFDELPPAGQTEWQSTRTREVVFVEEATTGISPRFPTLRYGRYLLQSPTALVQRTANHISIEEKRGYELIELTDAQAVVKTRLESSWKSIVSGKKAVALEGTGQYTFDRVQNVISKGHSQSELKVTAEGVESKLPFKVAFVLREAVTAEELKQRVAAAEAKRRADSEQRFTKAVAVLKENSAKPTDVRDALQSLARPGVQPAPREREEVSALLNKLLKSQDESIRTAAVRAAADWATATNIPVLLELLKTEKSYRRHGIIEALGATGGNAKVAGILAELMETSGSRFPARQALEKMGPSAEPAVLPLLRSPDRTIRDDACRILGEIGGKRSRAAFEAMLKKSKPDDFQNIQAKMALDKIKERLAADPD